MPETQTTAGRNGTHKLLHHSMQTIQARFDALEAGARGRLRKALGKGHDAFVGLDEALARVSREDWSVEGMRRRLDVLRHRAENLRSTTLKRVAEMPGSAVSSLASSTRRPVQNLARELERLARRLEPVVPEPPPAKIEPAKAEPARAEKKAAPAI